MGTRSEGEQFLLDTETEVDDNDNDKENSTSVPANTIPEEIWLKIFEMLDSTDLECCFRACKTWKKWIMQKRDWLSTVLFPEVASLLLEKLPKSVLLECRKVCQAWKQGIDHAYQTHPQHLRLDWETAAKEADICLPKLVNDFPSPEKIQRFLQDMEFHRGNPFVGRSISLNCEIHWFLIEDEVELFCSAYWNYVIQLLDMFGSQVHFAAIELQCYDHLAKEMVINLRNCLLRLPHLKRLKITKYGGPSWFQTEVQNYISANPLPLLINLETLEIEVGARGFTNEILNSSCAPAKIKRLDLGDDWGFCDAVFHFPNLEVMKSTFEMENFEAFRNLSRVPPLRELDLYFGLNGNYPRVFKSLELFGDTLTNVQVDVDDFFSHGNGRRSSLQQFIGTDARINLPKLKSFVLVNYDGPLEPFFELNSLEYLEIDYRRRRSDAKFHAFVEDMHQSSVWTLMPSLKKVLVSFGSCIAKYDRNIFENNPGEHGQSEEKHNKQCDTAS